MATVTVRFDADISEAKKQLKELQETGQKTQAAISEGKSTDRRAALEGVRSAKEQLAAAEKEKAAVQEKIKAQAQAVREAQQAVNAAKEGTKEHEQAARALERQQKAFEAIKQAGTMRGQAVDQAQVNLSGARKLAAMTPKVEPAPALSGFARIREAGLNAARRVASGFASMRARIASAFSGLRGVVAGGLAALGVRAGVQEFRALVNELDGIGKSSRALGVDTANFQKLNYAAKSLNVDFGQVQNAMGLTQKTIGEAANGSEQAAAKLARIGLTLADLKGKSASEQFDIVARAINGLSTQEEKAAAAAEMFGRSGVKLLDFLRQYKGLGDDLAARGGIIDDAQLRAAEQFNQCITDISATLKSMTINSGLLKQMSELLKLMDFFISGKGQIVEQKAAAMGVFNRKTGTDFAVNKLIESGKFSPEQAQRLKAAGKLYRIGEEAPHDYYHAEYQIIDEELKRRGLGKLARQSVKHWFGDSLEFGEDTTAAATQTPEEQAAEAKRLADARAARAAEAAKREAVKKQAAEAKRAEFEAKLAELTGQSPAATKTPKAPAAPKAPEAPAAPKALETPAAPKAPEAPAAPKAPEEKTRYIEQQIRAAETLAQKYGQTLTEEQRANVERAAAAKFDAAAQQKIDDYMASLKERYRLQQLIAAGKGREAAIEERLAEARKRAAEAGRELAPGEEQEIRDAAGGLYDLQHKQSATGPGRIGADSYATYALRSVGGLIEGASRVGTMAQDYPRQSAETLKDLQAQVSEIKAKLPERTEAGTTRLVL